MKQSSVTPSDSIVLIDDAETDASSSFLLETRLIAAAAFLREHGWTVKEPWCRTCGGAGSVGFRRTRPCPICKGTRVALSLTTEGITK
jgi:hypothetical protein